MELGRVPGAVGRGGVEAAALASGAPVALPDALALAAGGALALGSLAVCGALGA
ncbi:MAG: DUF998 domain-containing protein, partial [Myxococcales bacterium]|nr:DUF998 domain-containing protein [Myxococcales bacterium]